ncbi:DUF6790 family protein [Inconstantimicrobium porci]|uniref:DUF6790 family protein n=1 Tax=Inconstantimicrobium porci TaxID=2652291 RepID=UPI00240A937A|nr:DUF6790 family protein [Inconstantimicrobium porci]MDD6770187.1 hypothetical protein [Inconstantimicrobium porci]
MFLFIFCLIGIVIAVITTFTNGISGMAAVAQNLLFYQLAVTIPIAGVWGFTGHVLRSDYVADLIGLPKGSPFQKEVGYANLSYGVASFFSIFMSRQYFLAVIIMISVFYLGAAYGHIKEMINHKNFNPGNGFMTLPDILFPIFLIVLYILGR